HRGLLEKVLATASREYRLRICRRRLRVGEGHRFLRATRVESAGITSECKLARCSAAMDTLRAARPLPAAAGHVAAGFFYSLVRRCCGQHPAVRAACFGGWLAHGVRTTKYAGHRRPPEFARGRAD